MNHFDYYSQQSFNTNQRPQSHTHPEPDVNLNYDHWQSLLPSQPAETTNLDNNPTTIQQSQHGPSWTSTYSTPSSLDPADVMRFLEGAPHSDPSVNAHAGFPGSLAQHDAGPTEQTHQYKGGSDASIQLEVLRETRRIRELELSIAEERRRTEEELRKQREAELALAQLGMHPHAHPAQNQISPPASSSSLPTLPTAFTPQSQSLGSLFDLFPSSGMSPVGATTSASPASTPDAPSDSPPAAASTSIIPKTSTTRKTAKPKQKKESLIVEEHDAKCRHCAKVMVKLILRGNRSELDVPYQMHFECSDCVSVFPRTASRKRTNQVEDTTLPTTCSVCTRVRGQGGFLAKNRGQLSFTVEVICVPCSQKYKRCSNCGGGSTRLGIGKWRCKELFQENRKTCKLSHVSLGARDMEMAVWELPQDVQGRPELPELLEVINNFWKEHQLAKLAIPEVLEHSPGLSTYEDIERKIISMGFTARNLFRDPPMSPYHKPFVALTWARARARRDKSKPEWTKERSVDKTAEEWIAFNTKRTNAFIPEHSILCGVWMLDWSVKERTLNWLTVSFFDWGEMEDRSTYSFMAMLHRILEQLNEHNAKHPEDPWQAPAHLWSSIKANPYPLRLRLLEFLQRRVSMLPLDEYLARNPATASRSMFTATSGPVAKAISQRPSVDGHEELSILVKASGDMSLDDVKKVMEIELKKVPKGIIGSEGE